MLGKRVRFYLLEVLLFAFWRKVYSFKWVVNFYRGWYKRLFIWLDIDGEWIEEVFLFI